MAVISMKQLLEAGVHFGHQTRRWNPKMAPYIFTERNGIYIIDLQKTVKKVEEAYMFVRDASLEGGNVLFVGTKKQAQDSIKEEAERVGMYYVNARWLGGMLTNFKTIRRRIARLQQLRKMEEDGTFVIDFTPKKTKEYHKIRILISKDYQITKLEMNYYDSSKTEYIIEKSRTNVRSVDSDFVFTATDTKGIEIIDMR